jgi:hypothetical protein
MADLILDAEFQALLPPRSQKERDDLRADLLANNGPRNPLVAWQTADGCILLDGYNRHAICTAHLLPYRVQLLQLPDRAAATAWVLSNQGLLQRNLTADDLAYCRGLRYLLEKKRRGGNGSNQHSEQICQSDTLAREQTSQNRAATPEQTCQNGTFAVNQPSANGGFVESTAERLAVEFGVGVRTIHRDGRYAQAVQEILANCGEFARPLLLGREAKISRANAAWLADLPPEQQRQEIETVHQTGKLSRTWRQQRQPSRMVVPRDPQALAQTLVQRLERQQAIHMLQSAAEQLGMALVAMNGGQQ